MNESEFIDYYVENSAELTAQKEFSYEKKKEIILEVLRPERCDCYSIDCKGWKMVFRATNMDAFIKQMEEIKRREGL